VLRWEFKEHIFDLLAMARRLEITTQGLVKAHGAVVRRPVQTLPAFTFQRGVARGLELVDGWEQISVNYALKKKRYGA
jgi:hypothetical protein